MMHEAEKTCLPPVDPCDGAQARGDLVEEFSRTARVAEDRDQLRQALGRTVRALGFDHFALQGEGNGNIDNQTLQVFADRFLPQDADNLVTGEISNVDGTPFDFRKPVKLAGPMAASHPQVTMRGGLDIGMIINGKPGTLRPAAKLTDPGTGIVMDVSTTQPMLQLYSDNIGNRTSPGKGGKPYGNHFSMSLETEGYLDAVNHPAWQSTEVRPGKPMHEVTVFRFGLVK